MSSDLFPKTEKGRLFVLSGPSGSGKTTLVDRLSKELPFFKKNITFTTRARREKEQEGVDYHFISSETFLEMGQRGEFLEHVELFGNRYGTSIQAIENELGKGNHLILVIDVEGALKVKMTLDAPLIFVAPPGTDELKRRLNGRGSESPKDMEHRLERARFEITQGEKLYDYFFVNDDLEIAYTIFKSILIAELHKR